MLARLACLQMAMLSGVQVAMDLQRSAADSSLESPSVHLLSRGWPKSRARKLLLVSHERLKVEEKEIVSYSIQLRNSVRVKDPGHCKYRMWNNKCQRSRFWQMTCYCDHQYRQTCSQNYQDPSRQKLNPPPTAVEVWLCWPC